MSEHEKASAGEGAPSVGCTTPILRVENLDASLAYYADAFGFALAWRHGNFAQVERGDAALMLCEGGQGHAGTWVYVGVSDADALAREIAPRGGMIRNGPVNCPWGARELHVTDPDGHVLRFGSDAVPGEPLGDWIDAEGRRWRPQAGDTWRLVDGATHAPHRAAMAQRDAAGSIDYHNEAARGVRQAQQEMREVYLNGAPGQAVSSAVWLLSAACATWLSVRAGVLALVVGGTFIFPLTQLFLVATGRRATVSASNPLRELAPQVAFVVPLVMPLAGAAMLHRVTWFYPAFMVIVGAHYLPFAFLYGRRAFLLLAAVLVSGGFGLAFSPSLPFSLGAWFTGPALAGFAAISMPRSRTFARRREESSPSHTSREETSP